jgi:hypothetical protein
VTGAAVVGGEVTGAAAVGGAVTGAAVRGGAIGLGLGLVVGVVAAAGLTVVMVVEVCMLVLVGFLPAPVAAPMIAITTNRPTTPLTM